MEKNIVETAIDAGSFEKLVEAIRVAKLADYLSDTSEDFTVFAPNDEAFGRLGKAEWDDLLKDKEKLKSVLSYHVVEGKIMSSDISELDTIKSVQGERLNIDTSEGVRINNANIVQADIECSNGVIHVIDTVLMPRLGAEIPA